MPNDPTDLLMYAIILLVVFAIQVAILRWIFKVNIHIINQNKMVLLLTKLCEKHGVSPGEISVILNSQIKSDQPKDQSQLEKLLVGEKNKVDE